LCATAPPEHTSSTADTVYRTVHRAARSGSPACRARPRRTGSQPDREHHASL